MILLCKDDRLIRSGKHTSYHLCEHSDVSSRPASNMIHTSLCGINECQVHVDDDPVFSEGYADVAVEPLNHGLICCECYDLWKVWKVVEG